MTCNTLSHRKLIKQLIIKKSLFIDQRALWDAKKLHPNNGLN